MQPRSPARCLVGSGAASPASLGVPELVNGVPQASARGRGSHLPCPRVGSRARHELGVHDDVHGAADWFLITTDGASSGLRVRLPERDLREIGIPEAFAQVRGEAPPRATRFVVAGGRRADDFVLTSLPPITLISQSLKDAFASERISGFTTYSVQLQPLSGVPQSSYFRLAVTGRSGPIQDEKSERVTRRNPRTGAAFTVFSGIHFAENSWDGSDLFFPSDPNDAHLFCTKRVVDLFLARKLRGASFTSLPDVERRIL